MKIPNKRELEQVQINHPSDIDFKDFIEIYKKCTTERYYFLVNDTIYHQIILYNLEKIFWNKYIINHDN